MAEPRSLVGVVFVSHSTKIADGLVELARQMAAHVTLVPAGGTDEDGIGTSFSKVLTGIVQADTGAGVVVLCDLGSAILTAETACDFLEDEVRRRVRIADAPLVEGGVAAAVAAEIGGDLDAVAMAARGAVQSGGGPGDRSGAPDSATVVTRTVTLLNADGLHARPAAEFAKLASTFDARVTVEGRDATSLLAVMSLGLVKGARVDISASGVRAAEAVAALTALVESGFGET